MGRTCQTGDSHNPAWRFVAFFRGPMRQKTEKIFLKAELGARGVADHAREPWPIATASQVTIHSRAGACVGSETLLEAHSFGCWKGQASGWQGFAHRRDFAVLRQ